MKIKRKLMSLLLIILMVAALLPLTGAKDIQASEWTIELEDSLKGDVLGGQLLAGGKVEFSISDVLSDNSETSGYNKSDVKEIYFRSAYDSSTQTKLEWDQEEKATLDIPVSLIGERYCFVFIIGSDQYKSEDFKIVEDYKFRGDIDNITIDFSDQEIFTKTDEALYLYMIGALTVGNEISVKEDQCPPDYSYAQFLLDIDDNGTEDILFYSNGHDIKLEKCATNSMKGKKTIELKPETKYDLSQMGSDVKYYSSVTFVFPSSASGHDKGNYTLDLSAGKKVELSDPSLGNCMVFGMMASDADVVDSIFKSSTPQSWWIDLDRDGSMDVAFTVGTGVLEFEKRPTNSIKNQITIKLKPETISGLEFDAEHGGSSYYSSVTFIMAKPAVKPDETKPADTAATTSGTVKTTTGTYSVQNNTATFTAPAKKTAKTVTVPATIKAGGKTVKVTAIAPNALKSMKKLTKVTIGKNVTTIGKNAFANDAKLTTVTIGKNVKSIGAKAFYKCKALKKITIKTKKLTKKTVGSKAFTGISKKAVIKSPKAKKAAYKKILLKKGMKKTMTFK